MYFSLLSRVVWTQGLAAKYSRARTCSLRQRRTFPDLEGSEAVPKDLPTGVEDAGISRRESHRALYEASGSPKSMLVVHLPLVVLSRKVHLLLLPKTMHCFYGLEDRMTQVDVGEMLCCLFRCFLNINQGLQNG